jgi:hypothetical protein
MGEYILTDHAALAVILYKSAIAFQSISRVLIWTATLENHLAKKEKAIFEIRKNRNYGYLSFIVYSFFQFWHSGFLSPLLLLLFSSGFFG